MKQQKNHVKMTYDIVFKKFFTDKPEILKLILKHFLEIDSIKDITITNPEIPELEETGLERDKKEKQEPYQAHSSDLIKNLRKSRQEITLIENEIIKSKDRESLTFLDSSLPTENLDGKRVFLDLRVKLSSGEDINVEMQSYQEPNFLNRVLYYWAKLHSQSLKKGEAYKDITPTYSLIFTEKPFLDKRVRDFTSSFSIRRDREPFILLNKDLRIVIVELSKLRKSRSDLLDFKELWCYFIRESGRLTREDREYLSRHKGMEEAMEHFDKLSKEEKMQQLALDKWRNDMINETIKSGWIQKGIQKGVKEGMRKGRQERDKELALNMLKEGSEFTFISKVTGLSEDEIRKLIK